MALLNGPMIDASLQPVPVNPGDGERAVLLRAVRAGPLAVTLKRYRHDFEQAPHQHEHGTIDLVVSGSGRGTYRRKDMLSSAACVEYFAPGAEHSFKCGTRGICTMHVVVPGPLARREDGTGRALDLELDPSRCLNLAAALLREVTRSAGPDGLAVESLAFELLAEASRWPAGARGKPAWIDGVVSRLTDERGAPVALGELAAGAGVHPCHLAREFRRVMGVSVGTFSRRLRAAEASRRVAAGEEPLSRIAHACGYVDQAHLCHHLKSHAGLTPGAMRKLFTRGADGSPSP